MYFVTFIVTFAILLAYADDRKIIKGGFFFSFCLLTISMSLRYGYGNDFFSYMRIFNEISAYSSLRIACAQSGMEFGWVLMTRLLSPLGFQSQIFVTSVILYSIFYSLIYKYVPRPYRWLGLMIFLLNDSMFLLNLSMLRQGLSSALFFLSISFALEDKRIKSILFCLLGCSFHISALIGFPFLLLVFTKRIVKPLIVLLGCVVIGGVLFLNPDFNEYLFSFLLGSEKIGDVYGKYMTNSADDFSLGLGVLIQYISILPGLLYFKYLKEEDKYFVILYLMVLLLIPLAANAIMLLRIVSYFLPFAVILFPRLCDKHLIPLEKSLDGKNKIIFLTISKVSLALYLIYVSYSYYSFFRSETYGFAYKNFQFCF